MPPPAAVPGVYDAAMTCRVGLLIALTCAGGMLVAQAPPPPNFVQALDLHSAQEPKLSPDGRQVVYSVRSADWEHNAYVNQLWLAEVNGAAGARRWQLTRGAKSATAAAWSPDGKWIAFLAERPAPADTKPTPDPGTATATGPDKHPAERQIWVISPNGGEAWRLTQHATNVEAFQWSPDSRRIAFTAAAGESAASEHRTKEYSDYRVFEHDYAQTGLWAVAVREGEGGAEEALVNAATLNVGGFDWAPDGTRIAFSATRDPQLAEGGTAKLYLVASHPGAEAQPVETPAGPATNPHFSPDGTALAFNSYFGAPEYFYANQRIATLKLASPGATAVDVTANFDEDANLVGWGAQGIYFSAAQKTAAAVYRLAPGGALLRLTAADTYRAVQPSFTRDYTKWAFLGSDPEHMAEVEVSPTATFTPQRLTDFQTQLGAYTLGRAEVVSWTSQDGARIEGVLHKPANFVAGRKYPLLVVIHGGPTGVSNAALNPSDSYYPIQRFLARGALVLEPNYRGSAGYGAAFRKLNVRNLGVGDMWDVMSGVDALIARGLVDPSRMGAMGWSEGGYISAFLTTHTDRFKAISVGAGISDWMTYYVSTDITPFTRQYLLATPWSDPAIYAKTSPITTITQARTPTLIQQGSLDQRVPVPDSFELYRGLQDMHVPSRLILYTGYGHPITKPKSNLAVLQANWDWFAHYLWGDPIPADSPLYGTSELKP